MSLTAAAVSLADRTPDSRNRVVDLLRAAAIVVVVVGHWLVAGVQVVDGRVAWSQMLDITPWAHPLTWALQVMPVFFLVGGYANALSWRAARRRGEEYGGWLRSRLRRLVLPTLPLLLLWSVLAPAATAAGVTPGVLRAAGAAALVPVWFLAAYVVVVCLVPLTLAAWQRVRWSTVLAGLAAAALVDLVSVGLDLPAVGFLNYVLVWGSVHQLGYAWLDGALGGTGRRLALAAVGLVGLVLLVGAGPYAVSMVGGAGEGINNAYPTRVSLAFLGLAQAGLLLAAEPGLRRVAGTRPVWVATVLVNARIMTGYLWHMTVLVVVVAAGAALGGVGLGAEPGSADWWRTRPLWILVLAVVTAVVVAVLGRTEQPAADPRPEPASYRPVLAVLGLCAGLGLVAGLGLAARDGTVHWYLPLLPVLAAVLGGVVRTPLARR